MGGRKKREKHTSLLMGFPPDVHGGARVTMFARGSVLVEGQRGVVELGELRMRLRTHGGVLTVLGSGMQLRELSCDAAMITGERIETVTYGRTTEG